MSKVLSFDTSNYTTSVCVLDSVSGVLWENRIMLPVGKGMCGVRQNDAVFLHTKNLETLFDGFNVSDIDFIAASRCPSERENSYMPCFNVGISFANVLSNVLNVPLYTCSHQKNHIAAALYSANCTHLLDNPFLAYHISGGTTDILMCTPSESVFDVKKVGGTADISCGQLIDRAGVMLGLDFPCGKMIDKLSTGNLKTNIRFTERNGLYNLSGFQNQAQKQFESVHSDSEIADFVLSVVYSFLLKSVEHFRGLYGELPIVFSGGVMSNSHISASIRNSLDNVFFSRPEYSVDNSLGTSFMCLKEKGLI